MRCDYCQRITIDATNGDSYRAIEFGSHQPRPPIGIPHQPGFTALQSSASQGCDLCHAFAKTFEKSWDIVPIVELEKAGTVTEVWVRSDIYLSGLSNTNDFGDKVSHLTVELRIYDGKACDKHAVIENPYITFQIFTKDDDPAAEDLRILGRPLIEKAEESLSFMRASMKFCLSNHDQCPQVVPSQLPTRLIDVGNEDESQDPILCATSGEVGLYVTLSHCWGSERPLTTTNATLQQRMEGIPLASMPRTFADAVRVCRAFSIQYLWIDSLCIVQDSEEDWLIESARMGDIYSGSVFTIAASMAGDSGQGFLRARDRRFIESLAELQHIIPGTEFTGKLYLRCDFDSWSRSVNNSILAQRAWTLQERLLASRVMHFGDIQAFWECSQMCASEGSIDPIATTSAGLDSIHPETKVPFRQGIRKDLLSGWSKPSSSRERSTPRPGFNYSKMGYKFDADPMSRWYACVGEYTQRAMTKPSDKLPAIAGLAKAFSTKMPGPGVYLAGLWRHDLLRGLLWKPVLNGQLRRASGYVAPSWSWASVEGPVEVDTADLDRNEASHDATVTNVEVTPQGTDVFAQVSGGILRLHTRVRHAMYMGDCRSHDSIPVSYNGTHITIDHHDPQHYVYAVYEECEDQKGTFNPIAHCWFDEDPGKDPDSSQTVIGLIQIGRWAPLISTREVARDDGGRRILFINRDPDATFYTWALIVRWTDAWEAEEFDTDIRTKEDSEEIAIWESLLVRLKSDHDTDEAVGDIKPQQKTDHQREIARLQQLERRKSKRRIERSMKASGTPVNPPNVDKAEIETQRQTDTEIYALLGIAYLHKAQFSKSLLPGPRQLLERCYQALFLSLTFNGKDRMEALMRRKQYEAVILKSQEKKLPEVLKRWHDKIEDAFREQARHLRLSKEYVDLKGSVGLAYAQLKMLRQVCAILPKVVEDADRVYRRLRKRLALIRQKKAEIESLTCVVRERASLIRQVVLWDGQRAVVPSCGTYAEATARFLAAENDLRSFEAKHARTFRLSLGDLMLSLEAMPVL
ncbi:hypothetical protein EG329_005685 [Mollisiaceae sp. DMI_Dod_QoI]|nr:hypothetical protein EG329_005685 [Helotiales sp. DMI_Dod_QoI]